MVKPKILCIIPARSGSKGIKHKNIKMLKNKPMIYYSIEQALQCKYDMRIIVSTDSEKYKAICLRHSVEVPFLRPKDISGDLSIDKEFIVHCIDYLKEKENYECDFIVQLRPTYPLRKVDILNDTIKIFMENRDKYDSLRTVIPVEKSPFKMYRIDNNILNPLFKTVHTKNGELREPYNNCRQSLPDVYLHNGYIDILNSNILKNDTISGDKIYPYIMDKNDTIDIDTMEDWDKAE